jgi:hypothetical protein
MNANLNKLSRVEMKNLLGGKIADPGSGAGCVVYSISGSGSNTVRVAYGTAANSTAANALALDMVNTWGARYGYDCSGTYFNVS